MARRAGKGVQGGVPRLRAADELGCRARGRECCERYARGIRRPSLRAGRLLEKIGLRAGNASRRARRILAESRVNR